MILTTGQALDLTASHRPNPTAPPQGHNYRLWADLAGPVNPKTGLILPRPQLTSALSDIANKFDHQDFTHLLASELSGQISLAAAISHLIAAKAMPAQLATLEISDETGHGIYLSVRHPLPEGEGRGEGELPLPIKPQPVHILSGSFSAAHRAHAPRLTDEANRALFGTSNNPAGHGHNYLVEIESPGPISDRPAPWAALDHLNLSHDVPELQGRNAVTEMVAELIARRAQSASRVRVWESPDLFAVFVAATGRYQFGRRYRFHAAHDLTQLNISAAANRRRYGRCATGGPHGHAYTAYVVVEGDLDPLTDTVYNLADLDATAGALFRSLDYADWAQALPELPNVPTTAEQAAAALWRRLGTILGSALVEFTLYETPYQRVQVKRG